MESEDHQTPVTNVLTLTDDLDSACSTPFVSAPSSPGRTPPACYGGTSFFYSAPASPIHFMISTSPIQNARSASTSIEPNASSFEFEFTSKEDVVDTVQTGSMTSADELFLNGQIRPMKLSTHLMRPQVLSPLLDVDESDEVYASARGRNHGSSSLRRRARSMSTLRINDDMFDWIDEYEESGETNEIINKRKNELPVAKSIKEKSETTPRASSHFSSIGRRSKRWVFLKEFLYRSKSEGRTSTTRSTTTTTTTSTSTNTNNVNTNNLKFWTSLSFSPKDKKSTEGNLTSRRSKGAAPSDGNATVDGGKPRVKKAVNGVGISKRRAVAARSAHELHYTTNRAQAEELRRRTYLPYKQGLLGCLGFSSKSYGAMNGFARALNRVSSR